ncbi:alanine dehydrogenase [Flavobacterium psychrophilum]|uniref:Saccharopine dehydrogenase [NAD(+), L-lysine-forming] n=1 Tax=Flavobacterium psychrophilum (strain ATCC 49511 / DSM 21280 / CIP 103535 / JIP02/86) TaxID=402612 RepID=A6GWW4_FLAPJ|nr:NAD(P)-dependent oxidoreductase [Flavobacterium psychrophilum]AIG29391.1 alanine dehydrogenase [Flavobacterium psychrophilum]AIG31668.1 alanine dehydrogenase [Flavobacterium psychrophilum]AIG33822.1 alanine dehydrogenase [Flavobacterium psychrophilum]AIG36184.1 alanine dehydrogenase [Flavobacterium psychrophilum]AIG38450.1 alanine dehydrogenase [Flavobacterium psychrophilum]
MKFGLIKERKNPPDRRVVFTPEELAKLKQQFPLAEIKVESSDIRIFNDEQYSELGFDITTNLSDCDVLIGVKEVPIDALIPNKKYFFFSHTIKKQPYNRKLLLACLEKNIELYDHETIVDAKNHRLIGFGRYAGIVGAYNGIRAFGIKFELFNLAKAETLKDKNALVERLQRMVLPNIKIVLTGHGKVGLGAKEMLDAMKLKEVSIENYLTKNYDRPVYTHIDLEDYNKRIDGKPFDKQDFYANPELYTSNFERFTKVSDIFMAGHFYGNGAPVILSREMLKAANNKIKVVADISCDVDGPVACTLKASTIAQPFFGYYPSEHKEVDFMHPGSIVVMSVDNLPCELPKDASEGFGEMFLEHVIPAFYNNDKDGILQRAKITEKGKLTQRFSYLQDYVDGK